MTSLWQQYQQLKAEQAHLFQYDAAKILGVSEGTLLMSAPDVMYLGQDYLEILDRLKDIQEVQLMVRNEHAVHEKTTRIESLKHVGHVVLAVNVGGYDVRMFPKHWQHVVAFDFPSRGSIMRSIQFYDAFGHAVQKIYLKSEDHEIWQMIINDFQQEDLPIFEALPEISTAKDTKLDSEQQLSFQKRWREMTNVHQFFGLLKDFDLNRQQAFEHAPTGYAFQVDISTIEKAYMAAVEKQVPLIHFVGNAGIIQIQTGTLKNVARMQGWLNIFDGQHNGFTLHLDDVGITSAWLVLRPTSDGIVSCLECLDADGKSVVSIFGQRTEGQPELAAWREVLNISTGKNIQDQI